MLVSFRRIVRAGWTAFSRSSLLNIATIFVLVITISLVTSLFFLNKSVNYLSDFIRDRVDISVYFNEDVSEEDVLALKQEIEQLPEVKDVKYVSKEKALREFSEKYKHNKDIMESLNVVGSNPLLVSLNVRSWEADQYSNISNFLINSKLKDSINEIDYQQKEPIIQKLFSVTSSINKFGIIFSIILIIIAVLVAFNQVRMTIYNLKEEIKTMRLVGASNWFIKGPFIVQGIILGFLSALIAISIFTIFVILFSQKINIATGGLDLSHYFFSHFFVVFLAQLAIALIIEIFSTSIAVGKYLKV